MRKIVRKKELYERIGLSDTTIWRMEKTGQFPLRIQLGGNSVGWFEDEICEWFSRKASDRVKTSAM